MVEDVADLWALERAGVGAVKYHVLGGVLSPLDGVGPDDLSIDEIGVLYGVHRATVARWIASVRESLFELTRRALISRLSIDEGDVDSVLRMIDSQLDISIERVMR